MNFFLKDVLKHNHFRYIDYIIDHAFDRPTEAMIKQLHLLLKSGTSDSLKSWFKVGDYKKLPNEVGGNETCPPEKVHEMMAALLKGYNAKTSVTLEDIIDLHCRFERIHPFQDGNGRVGRLLMFKECLAHGIVPFIITEELKFYYYRGLKEWGKVDGYLSDTCLAAEDFSYALAQEECPMLVLQGPGFVYAPAVEGADAGFAYVLINGSAIGKVPVVCGATVEQKDEEQKGFWQRLLSH